MSALDRLGEDHRVIELLLDALTALAARAREEDGAVLAPARAVLDELRRFADDYHHRKEEEHLFPALVEAGLSRRHGPVACMLAEHDVGREHIRRMSDGLAALEAGAPAGGARFAEAAEAYERLLRGHIQKEDMALFRIAEQVLPADVLEELAARFYEVEASTLPGGRAAAVRAIRALVDEVIDAEAPLAP